MLALVAVSWKCRVPREKIEQDLQDLCQLWNSCCSHPVKPGEIQKALQIYGKPQTTLVRRETLAAWVGWEIPKAKRNGRKRDVHLAIVHASRRTETRVIITKYLSQNPGASIKQIARETGLDRNTVRKYLRGL